MATKKSAAKIVRNQLEAVTDFGDKTGIVKGVGKSLFDDLGKGGVDDFISLLGIGGKSASNEKSSNENSQEHGFIAQGEIVNFKKRTEKAESRVEAAIDYHRDVIRSSEQISRQEVHNMGNQIQEILNELKSLIGTSKMLQMEFAAISMEQSPTEVGVYHTNFFEWMLSVIRAAREKVEDSEAWLNTAKGKGSKKGYWGMFKKHGTSFGMSNERSVATQVG